MTETKKQTPAAILAHVISDLFSPLLAPSYGMIAAMWLTRLHYLPLGARLWSTVGIAAITALLPLIFILALMKMGKVKDTSISDPRQRTAPYCASILCYIGAAFFLHALQAPSWLVIFFVGAAIVCLLSLIITKWWKISAHTGGIAGLCAAIFWLARNGMIETAPLVWTSIAFILVGLVAWARLYLNHHTVMQVFAGAALAFAIEYTLLSI